MFKFYFARFTGLLGLISIGIWMLAGQAALGIGEQQPVPAYRELAIYHLDHCALPCWGGLQPGVTPSQDIKDRLVQNLPALHHLHQPNNEEIRFTFLVDETQIDGGRPFVQGRIRHNKQAVTEVFLQEIRLPLRYLLTELGTPDCTLPVTGSLDGSTVGVVLFWQWNQGQTALRTFLHGQPDTALQNPGATTHDLRILSSQQPCSHGGFVPWYGFVSLAHYEAALAETFFIPGG